MKLVRLFLGGAVVGLCATQALDWLSTILYESEGARARAAEDEARGDLQAYEAAILKIARAARLTLTRDEIAKWGWRLHKGLGVLGGLTYLALRKRYPRVGAAFGLAFGAGFFLGVDELLMPLLGLTPGPRRFPWQTHARGALSHLAYGVTAEAAARALDRWTSNGVRH
jgi:hypothetical protein